MIRQEFFKRTISVGFLVKNCVRDVLPLRPEIIATLQCSGFKTPVIRILHAAEHKVTGIDGHLKFRWPAVNEFGSTLYGNGKRSIADSVDTPTHTITGL